MKFAIVSDFHLGYNEDAFEQAKRALRSACEKHDFVIMAGDLFDARLPKQETIHEGVKLFKEFSEKLAKNRNNVVLKEIVGGSEKALDAAPLLGIYGTHERRAKGLSNIIQVLSDGGLMVNLHARKIIVEKLVGAKREKVCVQAMGGVPEEMAKKAVELLEFKPEPGCFNAFVFHQSVRELIPQDEQALSMADLPTGFDLYIDGHIHWRQELREGGKTLLIPGSTVVTQMKENEAHGKGYYSYDAEKRVAEFVEIPTRPFVYKELSFKNAQPAEIEGACKQFLDEVAGKYGDELPLVKLKVTGTLASGLNSHNLDLAALEKEYSDKMFLSLDKQVGSLELKEKIELLRKIREEKTGAREMGMQLLKKLLKEKGVDKELPLPAEELFELLSQGEIDLAVERILEEKTKQAQ